LVVFFWQSKRTVKGIVLEHNGIKLKIDHARKTTARSDVQGAAKAWKLALARSARDAIGLEMTIPELRQTRSSLAELLELPPERALIAMLEGPKEGLGLLVISPEILAGIVEIQMVGRVNTTAAIARRPTRTDAAMVSAMIDKALKSLELGLAQSNDLTWTSGFSYASFLEDARPLGLLLEDTAYQVLFAEVSLADGARNGQILLALPADGRGAPPKLVEPPPSRAAEMVFGAALGEQIMGSQAEIIAVLSRVNLPLDRLLDLKVGEQVSLNEAALDQICLEGRDGLRIANGKLGQNAGMRAIRIIEHGAKTPTSLAPGMHAPSQPAQIKAPAPQAEIKKAG
jgi:flagellar motor switch protein FliM